MSLAGKAGRMLAILDIDGTLVDTNYHHAIAWYRAFRDHDLTLPLARLHRSIGMGGDQLVAAVAGDEFEERSGDSAREAEGEHYWKLIDEVRALPGAVELVRMYADRGDEVVLASSAKKPEVEHYVELLGVGDVVSAWTSASDVTETKPAPDLVQAAMAMAADHDEVVLVGDSTYDCEAAARADVSSIGVLTGGFSPEELREAGASRVFPTPLDLVEEEG